MSEIVPVSLDLPAVLGREALPLQEWLCNDLQGPTPPPHRPLHCSCPSLFQASSYQSLLHLSSIHYMRAFLQPHRLQSLSTSRLLSTTARTMGVQKTIISEGNGPSPKKGDRVTMEYTGWLRTDGKPEEKGKQFDSSIGRGAFVTPIGVGRVIKGQYKWTMIEGMLLTRLIQAGTRVSFR